MLRAEQSRAEQSRAEQSRAEQSRAEQSRADAIYSVYLVYVKQAKSVFMNETDFACFFDFKNTCF
ncbi:hypothetical protein [Enterococcus raffinosus]|uniref:Uncharacterized protein n=1 Tax=Enterococcus raffinosus ATCC 49464 TaxID=1158602 RepID=R2RVL5_9ENTE|nr:hypothetical protein [Enterococcus raffinosus]EOH79934.1 hypothetical protein UAK_01087 [Enterococcus raffinosus ATCC 49464]EOT74241.1 hypothetical protein I590_03102 [Enterococcus raffinosus ATCC 49464]UXK05299.1 hypothetical protein N7K38_06010 [Enterococcus raffinosus]